MMASAARRPTAAGILHDEIAKDEMEGRNLASPDSGAHRAEKGAAHRSEESEALHRLLVDTSRKISDLDSLKSALDDMTLPFRGAMRALEQERTLSNNLSRQLGEKAAACDKLRDEVQHGKNRARVLEAEAESLRDALDQARESGYAIESAHALLSEEIMRRDEKIAALERQLAQEASQRRTLSDNIRALQEQAYKAEARMSELQDALTESGQACERLKQDKRSLWRSAELARDEAERVGRRLADGEKMLSAIRAELGNVEARHVEICAERNRLADTVDEMHAQHEAERQRFNGRLEALEARAAAAERAVAETRQRLIDRTEEARAFVCKAAEATMARAAAERRLSAFQVAQGIGERGDEDPNESRTALSEYLRALNLKSREMALAGSAERLAAQTDRKRLQASAGEGTRPGTVKEIEDIMTALAARDRGPRGDLDDALDTARRANVRLENEVASLRSGLSDLANPPTIAIPVKAETALHREEPPVRERATPELPGHRIGTASQGALAYESGLVAQLRPPSREDDTPRSVA